MEHIDDNNINAFVKQVCSNTYNYLHKKLQFYVKSIFLSRKPRLKIIGEYEPRAGQIIMFGFILCCNVSFVFLLADSAAGRKYNI